MKVFRWLGSQLLVLLTVIWINGFVLRITVRDSVDGISAIYYATPWPVIAAFTIPLIWRFRRIPAMVFGSIVLTHVFLAMWIMEDWRSGQPSHDPADLRVVQWNVARPTSRLPGISKCLREYDADVITVAEAFPDKEHTDLKPWTDAFPGYTAQSAPGEILCLVRGEVTDRKAGELGPCSYYALYDAKIKGRELRVLQVDLDGYPTKSRRQPLQKLAAMVETLSDRPLILAGDFNTPRDSVHYAPLRKLMVSTFETVGIGSGETWPMPLPVLSLDQIWCNSALKPVRCHHEISFRSDHRAVVSDLRFSE